MVVQHDADKVSRYLSSLPSYYSRQGFAAGRKLGDQLEDCKADRLDDSAECAGKGG